MKTMPKTLRLCASAFLLTALGAGAAGTRSEVDRSVMGEGYWKLWNDEVNAAIDARIEKCRKADCVADGFVAGTKVRVEQVTHAFQFGANFFNFDQLGDDRENAQYKRTFGELFNAATLAFYWKWFEWERGKPRFSPTFEDSVAYWNAHKDPTHDFRWRRPCPEPIIRYCEKHGIAMHGHVLIYPAYQSQWQQELSANELWPEYEKHIRGMAAYYQGRIPQWDVVNESVNRACTAANPNDDICWGNPKIPIPKDYTFKCHKLAEQVFPKEVKLAINDSWRPIYPPFVKALMDRGARIDVVGIQMHIFTKKQALKIANGEDCIANGTSWKPADQVAMLQALDTLGRPLHLSEITIPALEKSEHGYRVQAQMMYDNYRLWFSWPSIYRITYWNVVDFAGANNELLPSGIYTRDLQKKPAYDALDRLINHEWRTNLDVVADKDGKIGFRGFRGKYRLSWKAADGINHARIVNVQ